MLNTKETESTKPNENCTKEELVNNDDDNDVIKGLLFIGNLRNIRFDNEARLHVVIRGFWSDNIISTECLIDKKINFSESFSIIRNESFLEKVRNNHLVVELHEKDKKVIGVTKLPLHQFFIAFKDSEITNRLFQETLPVISIDDWVPVINPITNDCYGYLQSLFAMGTEKQIEHLKEKRDLLLSISSSQLQSNKNTTTVDSNYSDVTKIAKTLSENNLKQKCSGITSNHLGNFIENLLQQRNMNNAIMNGNKKDFDIKTKDTKQLQTRKTADLLDALNKALETPPNENDMFSFYLDQFNSSSNEAPKTCKILIEIERAVDLPRNVMKIGNKKASKRSANGGGKRKQSRFAIEEEPSAYVTFHGAVGYGPMVKSHEGFVYATNVVERNCSPIWGKKFEIPVSLDLFTNNEKLFILKVWRKVPTDLAQCRFQPLPMEDVVIGFSSVNLNLLSTTTCSQISDWFNIVDHNERIHGKLKIKIETLENVCDLKRQLKEINSKVTSIQNNADFNNTPLSRAIKRKFTELEEITERLKARLLGVTGDLDENEDDDVNENNDDAKNPMLEAQLDEFEHDLNTVCDEDDDDYFDDKYKNSDWSLIVQNNIEGKNYINDDITTVEIKSNNSQDNIQNTSTSIVDVLNKTTDFNKLIIIQDKTEINTKNDS